MTPPPRLRAARRSARCMRGDPAGGDRAGGACAVTERRSARRGEARRGRDTWRERCALWKENINDKEKTLSAPNSYISRTAGPILFNFGMLPDIIHPPIMDP